MQAFCAQRGKISSTTKTEKKTHNRDEVIGQKSVAKDKSGIQLHRQWSRDAVRRIYKRQLYSCVLELT